jgi:dTDP-4-amino-4,6-dideoxygalactose transaminase
VIRIPFNRFCKVGTEFGYIQQSIDAMQISGDGAFTKRCHALLEKELGTYKVLLTTSCTHALEMAALLLDIQPGDEVIVPSFTFVSTVNAFALRGARIVFADIRPDTLNLDENQLEALITPKTRAIVPVHYAGVGCEMDQILAIAKRAGAEIVEDNAHGLFGKYRGKHLGTFGALATQSFHETKNIACGEGGALLINNPRFAERAEYIREKGTNRSNFFRGQVDKYTWVDIGSSYLPSEILAAVLFAQLEARERIQTQRKRIWSYYHEYLREWAEESNVQVPYIPAECEQSYHMYYLILPSLEERARFIAHMRAREILTVFHYVPLHLSPMGQQYPLRQGSCPVAEQIGDRLVRLPFYNDLQEAELAKVVDAIRSFRCVSTDLKSLTALVQALDTGVESHAPAQMAE